MRKMIKWKPFNTIPEMSKIIDEIEEKKTKQPLPIIMQDLTESINYNIKEAIHDNKKIEIKYFKQGFLKYEHGYIEKIDTNKKYILINNTKIYFKNIINAKI